MGMPSINITFTELAKQSIDRSDNEIVALIVASNANMKPASYEPGDEMPSSISAATKTQINFALMGGRQKPQKVVVYFCEDAFANLEKALEFFETEPFDYMCFGSELTEEQVGEVKKWLKAQREFISAKAVLPNCQADAEYIINNTTESINIDDVDYDATLTCSRMAGVLAGTLMTMSATYTVLEDATDCTRLSKADQDKAVDNGELIVVYDAGEVLLGRAVNSLTTASSGKSEGYKKIKIVDIMDRIKSDVTSTLKKDWIGQYTNTYSNKCLLVSAVSNYLNELVQNNVLESATIDIDTNANKAWLRANGTDTSSMTDKEIKQANTGDKVFLVATIKMMDAIEDITIGFTI